MTPTGQQPLPVPNDHGVMRLKDKAALARLVAIAVCTAAAALWLWQALKTGSANEPPLLPFVLIAIGAAMLFSSYLVERLAQAWRMAVKRPLPPLGLLAAALLIGRLLWRLPLTPAEAGYGDLVLNWLLAFTLYTLAIVRPRRPALPAWAAWWRANRLLVLAVATVTLAAFLLRVWRIGSIPFVLSGDEAAQGLEALRVIGGEIRNPFATGWLSVPTISFFFNSITIRLLGPSMAALRLPWALVGTATVVVTFYLVARLTNRTLAFATAALLALYHYHIHFSRLGSNQVADPLFVSLALLCLYRALDRQRLADWLWTGAVCGLALYFYAGARFTPVVVLAILAYLLLVERRRFWSQHWPGLVVALGAFLLVAAPMMQYAFRFPNDFNARINEVGIIQSGWLAREVEIRGQSIIAILLDQFRRAALAFNYYPDRTVWYGLRQPLLDPVFGAIFLVGLGYGTLRALRPRVEARLFPMVAWWWGGVILGGMLTESPPSSMRLVTLAVPVCFFIALALWAWLGLARQVVGPLPAARLLATAVALFGLISLNTYFVDFTPQRIAGGTRAEVATELASILNDMNPAHRVYFVGAPTMFAGFATLDYLAPGVAIEDILEPLAGPPSPTLAPAGEKALFIFLPERINELALLRQTFPRGETHEIHSPVDGRVMATLYYVMADSVRQ